MLRLFVKHVLGGRSGKREAAWFVFFVSMGITMFVVFAEWRGVPMPVSQSILIVVLPTAVIGVLTAHGIEHFGGADLLSNRRITIGDDPHYHHRPVPDYRSPSSPSHDPRHPGGAVPEATFDDDQPTPTTAGGQRVG